MEWITVFSPASIGNIGPGFDVLGMAIKGLGDTIQARKIEKGIIISSLESIHPLTNDPTKNTVTLAAKEVLTQLGINGGIEFRIKKGLPIGSGLGSSAASVAAGAFAANYLYGNSLTKEQLVLPATKAEEKVSGGFFADNTAPALLGGATLTRSLFPLDIIHLGTIKDAKLIVVTPNIKVLTSDARKIIPQQVPLKDVVSNMAHTALIAAAFSKNNYAFFSKSLHDVIIEPARSSLIPGFYEVKQNAILAGADGVAIAGSGPAMFAITHSKEIAENVKRVMIETFQKNGIFAQGLVTEIDVDGTRLI